LQIPSASPYPLYQGETIELFSFPLDKEGGPLAVGDLKKLHPEWIESFCLKSKIFLIKIHQSFIKQILVMDFL